MKDATVSSSVAGLLAVAIPAALIAVSAIVMSRSRAGASPVSVRPIAFGWRLWRGFAPYLFVIGVIGLYVWFRGVLGLQPHTALGSWSVLTFGLVLTVSSVIGYTGALRRRRAARRTML